MDERLKDNKASASCNGSNAIVELLARCGGIVVDPLAGCHEINKLLPIPGDMLTPT
jgi:hypothetical protein